MIGLHIYLYHVELYMGDERVDKKSFTIFMCQYIKKVFNK